MYHRTSSVFIRLFGSSVSPTSSAFPFQSEFSTLRLQQLNITGGNSPSHNIGITSQNGGSSQNRASSSSASSADKIRKSDLFRKAEHSQQKILHRCVARSTIPSQSQQKEHAKVMPSIRRPPNGNAIELVKGELSNMVEDVHKELDGELLSASELSVLAK